MQISFLGAADTVTGSRHLVEHEGARVLLDCGLFQGYKTHRERNWAPFPVAPREIDAVLLSHAHLDHSGWLPALVKHGFRGVVHATAATRDLAEVMLLDAAHLQEEDARRANKGGWSRHAPALPLFTAKDALKALTLFKPLAPGRRVKVAGGIEAELTPVGHLLGACAVTLRAGARRLVFSGDLGREDDLLMPAPAPMDASFAPDALVVESTYGDRLHPREDAMQRLGDIVRRTVRRGGTVLMPTFAVGRAQALMLLLQRLKAAGEIPADLPVYLDSPMAGKATAIYERHRRLLRLAPGEVKALDAGVQHVETPQASQRLTRQRWPSVIMAGSGMATGGRVLHHLVALAPNPRHHIVFPGFQVPGSRGAKLVGGAREVKIFGQYVAVKAEVSHLEGLSGHADADGLMQWLRQFHHRPRQVFVVHGDPQASDALRIRIEDELGWPARVPQHGQTDPVA
jgi:metallo-beta-lactamase family protein